MSEITIEQQKTFYRPICNEKEIERIFNVQNAKDYLLKLRADTIVDHMRLFRVYRNLALAKGKSWSLEKSFTGLHFVHFKNSLPNDMRIKCEEVTYGNIFSNNANGQIFQTNYGPISTLSYSLRYFFEFMNLGLLDFGKKVPSHVRFNAMKIAIRVLLQTEALDFLMDPRGIIPTDIQKIMYQSVPFQMQYIAGHEYAHYILGHISDDNTSKQYVIRSLDKSQNDYKLLDVYNTSQRNEFEADIASINLPQYDQHEKTLVFESALLWFACLDIHETVENFIFPPFGYVKHPPARDRYFNLLNNVKMHTGFDYKYWDVELPKTLDFYKKVFEEDASLNIESYECYGSIYLDKPNTEWRGRELVDRVDYY